MREKESPDERLDGNPDKKAKSRPEKKAKSKPEKKKGADPKVKQPSKPDAKGKATPEKKGKANPPLRPRGPGIAELGERSSKLLLPAVLLFVAFLVLFATVSTRIAYNPDISAGIRVGDLDFGGVAPEDLLLHLTDSVPEPNPESVITLQTEGWQTQRTFEALGVGIDWEELQRRVLSPGHEGGLIRRLSERIALERTPRAIEIPIRFQPDKVDSLIRETYQALHRPATGATLELTPEEAILHSGADGETVDIPTLAGRLRTVMETRQSGTVRIPRQTIRSPALHAEALLRSIVREPRNASVNRNSDGTHTLIRSHPGRAMTLERLQTEINRLESRSDRRSVSRVLPVDITPPEITETDIAQEIEDAGLSGEVQTIGRTGMFTPANLSPAARQPGVDPSGMTIERQVAAHYQTDIPLHSDLDGARHVNITLAADAVNGIVLQPGAVFSFNGATGRRTRAKGYVDAPAYAEGRVILDVGGGICQVSTTLFNAALLAGLEPVERHNHMFTVSYAAPGRDASVSYGSQDLRLRNPHPFPVRLRVSVRHNVLLAEIMMPRQMPAEQITLYTRITDIIPTRTPDTIRTRTAKSDDAGGDTTATPVWTSLANADPDIGLNGAVVETWRQRYQGGNLLEEERLYVSRYAPFPAATLPASPFLEPVSEEEA